MKRAIHLVVDVALGLLYGGVAMIAVVVALAPLLRAITHDFNSAEAGAFMVGVLALPVAVVLNVSRGQRRLSAKAAAAPPPDKPLELEIELSPMTIRRGFALTLAAIAAVILLDVAYVQPRHGGYIGWATDGFLAGSDAEALHGNLGAVRSALSLYYGDHDRRYPPNLETLWAGSGKYLQAPLGAANTYVAHGSGWRHAHWYRDRAKITNFMEFKPDDAGGWGYVSNPRSADWGKVFVNCTHPDFRRRDEPWSDQ